MTDEGTKVLSAFFVDDDGREVPADRVASVRTAAYPAAAQKDGGSGPT